MTFLLLARRYPPVRQDTMSISNTAGTDVLTDYGRLFISYNPGEILEKKIGIYLGPAAKGT